jgi:hypothetical protein
LLDWSTLHKCAPVIKSLKVQYHSVLPPYPFEKSVSDFRHFCKNASSLEQLSISGIEVFIKNTSGDKYTQGSLEQFLVRTHLKSLLESAITDMHSQDCVRTASALVVLKLTVWKNYGAIPRTNDTSTNALRKARTESSSWSVLLTRCSRRLALSCASFMRSKQIDLFGHTTVVGMPVEPHMVKHYEPCSDILEPDRFVFA